MPAINQLLKSIGVTIANLMGKATQTPEMTAPWKGTTTPTILLKYELKDIFKFLLQRKEMHSLSDD